MTIQIEDIAVKAPMGVEGVVALVRAAAEQAPDPAAAKLAAQARASRPDVAAALAAFPDGSPEAAQAQLELKALGVPASRVKASVAWHRSQVQAQAQAQEREAARRTEAAAAPKPGDGWEARLVLTAKDEPESVTANAITILRCHPDWKGVLAWDDFQESIVFRSPPPWDEDDAPQPTEQGEESKYLTDTNATALAAWLCRHYNVKLSDEQAYKAARVVAKGKGARFNSMQDYFNGLRWDGVDRLGALDGERSWLTSYLGVEDTPYARFVGRIFPISAVARAFKPGCQADCVLILEGKLGPDNQGSGKSTALRRLFGDVFSDSPVDINNKDKFVNLRGVLCQSFDELAALTSPVAQDNVKNYLSAQYDVFRAPYAVQSSKVLRRNVFAGTVNPKNGAGYLRDETGARRFLPVTCGVVREIDLEAITRDRDQVWAQAVHAFKAGEYWHPKTPEEKALCAIEQTERGAPDPWDEKVAAWLLGRRWARGPQILSEAIGMATVDQEQRDWNRIGAILARLGWYSGRPTIDGKQVRAFVAPTPGTLRGQMLVARATVARLEIEMRTALERVNVLALQCEAERVEAPSEVEVESEREAERRDLLREPGDDGGEEEGPAWG